jgi:hypothetical protein
MDMQALTQALSAPPQDSFMPQQAAPPAAQAQPSPQEMEALMSLEQLPLPAYKKFLGAPMAAIWF